jgi:acetyltransferase
VVAGDLEPGRLDDLEAIDGLCVLGPQAVLRVSHGNSILCAQTRLELEALRDALAPETYRLALCPTPSWLVDWLEHPVLEGCTAAGFVGAASLTTRWAHWIRRSIGHHVLVPLGLEPPRVDRPRDATLEPAVAAHALERATGPVFPAPRVVAIVLAGGKDTPRARSLDGLTTEALAVWEQAKRALPMVGALVGMESPDPELPLDIATATFLAQRAVLRVRHCRELLRTPVATPDPPEDDLLVRAEQVLASAGEVLSDHESKVVLRAFGIEVTRQAVATSPSGAAHYGETIGFPVVLKAVSPDLRRKQEIGAVTLGLCTAAAVRRAYATIVTNVQERAPTANLDGVLVAEMVDEGLDIHCGGVRTAGGEIALFGRALSASAPLEPVLGLAPLAPEDAVLLAHAVLSRVPVPALRRATDPRVHPLATLFLRLDALFATTGDRLRAVDLNPVRLVDARGYVTLDARISQDAHLEGM